MKKAKFFNILYVTVPILILLLIIIAIISFVNKPTISIRLAGEKEITINAFEEYKEEGYSVFYGKKELSGDIVSISSNIDITKPGTYTIIYTANHSGSKGNAKRKVKVVDNEAPVITAPDSLKIRSGGSVKNLSFSVFANDKCDGDLSDKVKRENTADSIILTVKDSAGNVAEKIIPVGTVKSGRIVYLTFDDGPYAHTGKILDILKSYNAKATFFVTNQFKGYEHYISRMAKEGHTVGAHTSTHRFEQIYASREAYLKDLEAINETIKSQTGEYTSIIRFPGGSSNAKSKKYCKGIMSDLTAYLPTVGYSYFDWNVDSSDASGSQPDAKTIADNVIKALGNDTYVVLMHDTKKANIESLPIILQYCHENGYLLEALTKDSKPVRHKVNN